MRLFRSLVDRVYISIDTDLVQWVQASRISVVSRVTSSTRRSLIHYNDATINKHVSLSINQASKQSNQSLLVLVWTLMLTDDRSVLRE